MWGILGFAASVFGLLVDGVKWLRKRRRTKTEPQGAELPNRDALVRAIGEVASTAKTLLVRMREVHMWGLAPLTESSRPRAYESAHARDSARVAYASARETLDREKLVAGYAFREPISDFVVCVMEQFDTRAELRPEDMSGLIDINMKAEETVKRIDAIICGQENL